MSKAKTTLSDKAGFLIVANLIKYAVGFIMPMVLVRMLSQTEYGTYQQMLLISGAFGILTLGLPVSIYYFFPRQSQSGQAALVAQTTVMLTIAGVVAAIGIYLSAPMLAGSINNPTMVGLLQIFGISALFMIASEHAVHVWIAQDRYRLAVSFEVIETVVRVALLLLPLWLGFGFEGMVIAIVAYALLRFVARNGYLFAKSGLSFAGWRNSTSALAQLAYSLPIALGSVAGMVGGIFNRGIIAVTFTPAQFAIYAVGALEIPLDSIFQASVANVLRASLPSLVRDGNYVEVVRLIRGAVRKLAIIVVPSFVFLFGYSYEFITTLFTHQYAESVVIFQIYLLLVPLHMFVLSLVPQVFGKTKLNLYIIILSTVVLLLLSYILLKALGFYGPAIAFVITQYLTTIVYLVVVIRLTHTTIAKLLPVGDVLRIVVVALICLLAARIGVPANVSGLLGLTLAGVIFTAVFFPLALITRVFTTDDRKLMQRWIARLWPTGTR
jgi:O-antigen/teichoic acid export membrane protein